MEFLGGLIVVLGFLGLAKVFGLVERNLKVIEISRSAASVVNDRKQDDFQKEKALQKHAIELLVLLLLITGITILSVGIPLGVVWLMDSLGWLSFNGVIKTISSAWFILSSLGITLVIIFLNQRKKAQVSEHTQGERILQGLAFEPWFPRVPLSTFENWLYKKQLASISVEKPVFITALPRSGTTLLLEICVGVNEFASHAYRDMPFLLTPLLWNRFSKRFQSSGEFRERIHGDGILVNEDSPESFEEILWKEFWPSYYLDNRIIPWSESPYPDFEDFFLEHMRKIILLRSGGDQQSRYISKNNLNIARIGYLGSLFPDATILILFRSPVQHAASLLKQHQNFLRIHRGDRFAKKYMEDTGHFDFGENLRPIDFNGWLNKEQKAEPDDLLFWLLYWINTYSYLLKNTDGRVRFFSFDSLCAEPENGLARLGKIIEVENLEQLMRTADRIKPAEPHVVNMDEIPPDILEQAGILYHSLQNTENHYGIV